MADQEDRLFQNQRFEGAALEMVQFKSCTFSNVSFKSTAFRDCRFTDCIFEACYFRETHFVDSHFSSSRFIDCEFVKPHIMNCDFGYTRYTRTLIPFASLQSSLPGSPNIGRELAHRLAVQATHLGSDGDARAYRLTAIDLREQELWRAFRGSDTYFRSHYPGTLDRIGALLGFAFSKVNGALWGYGEAIGRLVINMLLIVVVIFPLVYLALEGQLRRAGGLRSIDAWSLSITSFLNSPSGTGVSATGLATVATEVETATGLLFFGLFVAYLFRSVTRR